MTPLDPPTAPPPPTVPARWTASELARLERLLARVEKKRDAGKPLTPQEDEVAGALEEMSRAEANARDAFSSFYAVAQHDADQVQIPRSVGERVNDWIEASRRWEAVVAAFLATPPDLPARRVGPRDKPAALPALLRVPASLAACDALAALFAPHLWQVNAARDAVEAQRNATRVRIDCDDALDFGPERAIHQIAKHGPAAAQTFLAMAGLWVERSDPAASHETYLTVYASDLLRFQGRKETPRGGYHRDDILSKGRDVYLLSRISLPRAGVSTSGADSDDASALRTLTVSRLLSLESLETEEDAGSDGRSVVRFRYHLGEEVHAWLCGERARFALLSGRLLSYHPVRQKYQILLGFCLAYAARAVQGRGGSSQHTVSLPALLRLAAVPVPDRRVAAFLVTIEEAIADLARDGVIPGLRLQKPADWTELLDRRQTREILTRSVVTFSDLPAELPPPAGVA